MTRKGLWLACIFVMAALVSPPGVRAQNLEARVQQLEADARAKDARIAELQAQVKALEDLSAGLRKVIAEAGKRVDSITSSMPAAQTGRPMEGVGVHPESVPSTVGSFDGTRSPGAPGKFDMPITPHQQGPQERPGTVGKFDMPIAPHGQRVEGLSDQGAARKALGLPESGATPPELKDGVDLLISLDRLSRNVRTPAESR